MVSLTDNNNIRVAAGNITSAKNEEVKKLVKYVNNEPIKEVPDSFSSTAKSAVTSAAVFEGIPALKFIKRCKKMPSMTNASGDVIVIKDVLKGYDEAGRAILKDKNVKLPQRILNYITKANDTKKEFSALKSEVKSQYKMMQRAAKAKNAVVSGGEAAVKEAAQEAAKKATKETAKEVSQSKIGKALAGFGKLSKEKIGKVTGNIGKFVKTKSGNISQGLNKLTGGVSGKIGKFMKSSGAGFMLVFSGISECVTEVVPTFKELGKEKGMKQIGKSAIKVAGDTFGFIAGEQAGVALGTAIGTAICPGVGSIIGGVCGFVGGMLGSFAAGKLTKAITGKTEREKAQEEQEQKQAEQIANNEELLNSLKAEVTAKMQEELSVNGQLNEESLLALDALNNLETSNPFAA